MNLQFLCGLQLIRDKIYKGSSCAMKKLEI